MMEIIESQKTIPGTDLEIVVGRAYYAESDLTHPKVEIVHGERVLYAFGVFEGGNFIRMDYLDNQAGLPHRGDWDTAQLGRVCKLLYNHSKIIARVNMAA